jgi:hypothetical protein
MRTTRTRRGFLTAKNAENAKTGIFYHGTEDTEAGKNALTIFAQGAPEPDGGTRRDSSPGGNKYGRPHPGLLPRGAGERFGRLWCRRQFQWWSTQWFMGRGKRKHDGDADCATTEKRRCDDRAFSSRRDNPPGRLKPGQVRPPLGAVNGLFFCGALAYSSYHHIQLTKSR